MVSVERGSASLEFIVAAVVVLVPLVALTVTTSDISSATFAATTASRQGVRAFARAENPVIGASRVAEIVRLALADHGVTGVTPEVEFECPHSNCLRRGSLVSVKISLAVPLRFVPSLPGIDIAPRVTVSKSATARISLTSVSR